MSLMMSWSRLRPGTAPPACPACGRPGERDMAVFIRHEGANDDGRCPVVAYCRSCDDGTGRSGYLAGVAEEHDYSTRGRRLSLI